MAISCSFLYISPPGVAPELLWCGPLTVHSWCSLALSLLPSVARSLMPTERWMEDCVWVLHLVQLGSLCLVRHHRPPLCLLPPPETLSLLSTDYAFGSFLDREGDLDV